MEHSTLQGRFQARFFWTALALLALAVFPLVAPALGLDFYISFVRRVLIYALAATSLNLILGYGGMVALGHAAFFGAGAYAVGMLVFAIWTFMVYTEGDPGALVAGLVGILAAFGALIAGAARRSLAAFWLNGASVAAFVAQIFIGLYPNALPSTVDDGFTLTLQEAASGDYTLTVITVVAAIALPVIIAYQAWSFWVFRKRISRPA